MARNFFARLIDRVTGWKVDLIPASLTSDRQLTLPDESGTLATVSYVDTAVSGVSGSGSQEVYRDTISAGTAPAIAYALAPSGYGSGVNILYGKDASGVSQLISTNTYFSSYAQVRALSDEQAARLGWIYVSGRTATTKGGGNFFRSTAQTDNDGTILTTTAGGYSFIRQSDEDAVHAFWFLDSTSNDGENSSGTITTALQAACDFAVEKRKRLFLPRAEGANRRWVTRATITVRCDLIGANVEDRTAIQFSPTGGVTERLAALQLAGSILVENIAITGPTAYDGANDGINSHVNPALLPDSSAFSSVGAIGFLLGFVPGGTSTGFTGYLHNCYVSRCKFAYFINSPFGHITLDECNSDGVLIGIYWLKNNDDYVVRGGTYGAMFAAFAFTSLGNILVQRVHFGFVPYCFYQVIDSTSGSTSPGVLNGLYASRCHAEQTSEAFICAHPSSSATNINVRDVDIRGWTGWGGYYPLPSSWYGQGYYQIGSQSLEYYLRLGAITGYFNLFIGSYGTLPKLAHVQASLGQTIHARQSIDTNLSSSDFALTKGIAPVRGGSSCGFLNLTEKGLSRINGELLGDWLNPNRWAGGRTVYIRKAKEVDEVPSEMSLMLGSDNPDCIYVLASSTVTDTTISPLYRIGNFKGKYLYCSFWLWFPTGSPSGYFGIALKATNSVSNAIFNYVSNNHGNTPGWQFVEYAVNPQDLSTDYLSYFLVKDLRGSTARTDFAIAGLSLTFSSRRVATSPTWLNNPAPPMLLAELPPAITCQNQKVFAKDAIDGDSVGATVVPTFQANKWLWTLERTRREAKTGLVSAQNYPNVDAGTASRVTSTVPHAFTAAAWKAFNGLTTDDWAVDVSVNPFPFQVTLDLTASYSIDLLQLDMTSGITTVDNSATAPRSFIVKSSTDGVSWTNRATFEDIVWDLDGPRIKEFPLPTIAARYWAIEFLGNNGNQYFAIRLISFRLKTKTEDVSKSHASLSQETATIAGGTTLTRSDHLGKMLYVSGGTITLPASTDWYINDEFTFTQTNTTSTAIAGNGLTLYWRGGSGATKAIEGVRVSTATVKRVSATDVYIWGNLA